MTGSSSPKTALIVGASRGLGFALAEEYLKRGWRVIATGRANSTDRLDKLAAASSGRLEVDSADINEPDQVAALKDRLAGRTIDLLYINAGVTNDNRETIGDVSTDEFVRVMVTNSLSPMRVLEALQHLVPPTGTIALMSSGLGSLANNTSAGYEVYRGSKVALNMFMRSFAARHADDARALLITAPGWVKTDMGGPDAALTIEQSIPNLVNTVEAHAGRPGLHYVDYQGQVVPW